MITRSDISENFNKLESNTGVYRNKRHLYYVFTAPTLNCQVFSIGSVNCILALDSNINRLQQFLECFIISSKNIMLIDIRETDKYSDKTGPTIIEEIFPKEDIISRVKYKNGRYDHNMVMYLIKTTVLQAEARKLGLI